MEGSGQGGGRFYSSYQGRNQFKSRSSLKAKVPTQRPSTQLENPHQAGEDNGVTKDQQITQGFLFLILPNWLACPKDLRDLQDKTQQGHKLFPWQFPSIQSWLVLNKSLTKDLFPPMKERETQTSNANRYIRTLVRRKYYLII